MQSAAPGAMLSVALSASELEERIAGAGCSLAAINGPQACVISGDEAAITLLEQELISQEAVVKRLATSHAYHSASMDPILPAFFEEVKKCTRNKPQMAFMSNVTGELISDEQAIDPQYWVNHLRGTVNFSQGIENVSGAVAGCRAAVPDFPGADCPAVDQRDLFCKRSLFLWNGAG